VAAEAAFKQWLTRGRWALGSSEVTCKLGWTAMPLRLASLLSHASLRSSEGGYTILRPCRSGPTLLAEPGALFADVGGFASAAQNGGLPDPEGVCFPVEKAEGCTLTDRQDGPGTDADRRFMCAAIEQAEKSLTEGGVPIGAALIEDGVLVATGHNCRVQNGDPIAHGEMDCLRAAGRRRSYRGATLYTTLSPCMMCAGTIVQFKIPRVVVGENSTFGGNEDFLRSHGVEVVVLGDERCKSLMRRFQAEHLDIWNEDIAE
jgi:cytosine/creatinine deaminase